MDKFGYMTPVAKVQQMNDFNVHESMFDVIILNIKWVMFGKKMERLS